MKENLIEYVEQYIKVMKDNDLGFLKVKSDDFEIELGEKKPPMPPMPPMPAMAGAPMMTAPAAAPAPAAAAPVKAIKSPIVGTFYAAPSPDKPPFVKVGDTVAKGSVVCIVESMKVMNEIVADMDGVVAQIAVKDGEPVEFDQPLIVLQ